MNFDIFQAAKEKRIVVAHRGVAGGNIPCNTLAAYEIALKQGADMIELDVAKSLDGTLYCFHPGMEPAHLYHADRLKRMTDEEISYLRYVNFDNVYTQFPLNKLDDVLEALHGRCFINVDKFWENPTEILRAIKRHNIAEQIIVKSAPSEQVFSMLESEAPELAFLPIISKETDTHEHLIHRHLNYVGMEILFYHDEDIQVSPTFIDQLHKDGKLTWANSIIYNHRAQIAAGHSDDTSLLDDPAKGWGWLAARGFDIIQTDWPLMMIDYLKSADLYYKK